MSLFQSKMLIIERSTNGSALVLLEDEETHKYSLEYTKIEIRL